MLVCTTSSEKARRRPEIFALGRMNALRRCFLLMCDSGLRVDGRRPPELRKLQCQLGVFKQADGSALLEQGNTRVLATVYGPHEVCASQVTNNSWVLKVYGCDG